MIRARLFSYVLAQLVGIRLDACDRNDDGDDGLTPLGILNPDDGNLAHVGMLDEDVLEFGRGDCYHRG